MATTTIKYFLFAHLPSHLQAISKPVGVLADQFEQQLPDGPEKSAGMRKLLEAKDCFVRAALDAPKASVSAMPPHQQRVVDERAELVDKLGKLEAFTDTPLFAGLDEPERKRLMAQHGAMFAYSAILAERIAAFPQS